MTVAQRIRDHWQAANWWRLHALESAIPDEHLRYASNLRALTIHMIAKPHMYQVRGELTDWQIYQRST
jgi:hypothetical protein